MSLRKAIFDFRVRRHRLKLLREIQGGEHLHLGGRVNVIAPRNLNLGKYVRMGGNCYLNCAGGISIGNHTILSRNVTIYSYDHDFKSEDALPFGNGKILKPVQIGSYVWIGMNVCIAPGTKIGNGAIIGLGTVVSGEIPENAICVSEKARIVGFRDAHTARKLAADQRFYHQSLRI
jgi:acetyltransferase-like isoleucine patch superfamily enzyme